MSKVAQEKIAFPGFSKSTALIHQVLTKDFGVNPGEAIRLDNETHIQWNFYGDRGTSVLIALHLKNENLYFVFDYILAKIPVLNYSQIYTWLLTQHGQYAHLARLGLREIDNQQYIIYNSWGRVEDLTEIGFRSLLLKMKDQSETILDQLQANFEIDPFLKDRL